MAGIIIFPEKNLIELIIFSAFLLLTLLPYRKNELNSIPKHIRSKFLISVTVLQLAILGIFAIKNTWGNIANLYILAAYALAITLLIANLKLVLNDVHSKQ